MPTALPRIIFPASVTAPDYVELGEEHGLREGDGAAGPWAEKPLLVAYSDRFAMSNALLNKSGQSGGATGPWSRTNPATYPGSPNLYATETNIQPVGVLLTSANGAIAYDYAIIMARFGVPTATFDQSQDPVFLNSFSQDPDENSSLLWASQEIDFAAEWINLPNSSVKFKSDESPINTPLALRVSVHTMTITWHRLPYMPMGQLRNYADSVNDKKFLGCDKGTVYCLGVKTVREMGRDGTVSQKVQMSFKWRKKDWNMRLRSDGFTWDYVIDKASSPISPIYTLNYLDFRKLLL